MTHHTAEGAASPRRQARGALVAAMFLCLMGAPGVANAEDIISVDISPGDTEETNVGCGFELITEPKTLGVDLYWPIPTPVDDSVWVERAPVDPNHAWVRKSKFEWRCFGVEPYQEFWVVLWGVKGGRVGTGRGRPNKRWMSVSDCDLDADTDNDSTLPHRPPEATVEEDLAEWPSALQDEVIGLLIPINDDNDLAWNQRDGLLGMGDYVKDNDLLASLLTINAMKAGELQLATGEFATLYDEAGHWYLDAEFDKRVPRGKDFPKPLRIEGFADTTSGTVGELSLYFLPDEARVRWSEDKVKCLYVGVDLDVDSDNNGTIEPENGLVSGEDFYEGHTDAGHPPPSLYQFGMIVAVNDDDDGENGQPDNGWDGAAWGGPDANTIQGDDDRLGDMRIGYLRGLGLGEGKKLKIEQEYPTPKFILRKVGGDGAVRIFQKEGLNEAVVLTAVNNDDWSDSTGAGSLWNRQAPGTFMEFYVEGLRRGEVVLQAEFRIRCDPDDDNGILIHADRVRLSVIEVNFRNPIDTDNDGNIDDDANNTNHTGNEFTYNTATPGVLAIPVRVEVLPDTAELRGWLEDKIRLQAGPINDSHTSGTNVALAWDHPWPGNPKQGHGVYDSGGQTWNATATFTAMPPDYDNFGEKHATAEVVGVFERKEKYEVFWPRDGTNHPGGQSGSPNWFYYWGQVYVNPDVHYVAAAGYGETPGIQDWAYNTAPDKTRIEIGNGHPTAGSPYGVGEWLSGIDFYVGTVIHEETHVDQIALADTILPTTGNDSFRFGWSWRQDTHNHWGKGTDGQWGVANFDDDGNSSVDDAAVVPPFEPGNGDDVSLEHPTYGDWPNAWALPNPLHGIHPIEAEAVNATDAAMNENDYAPKDWGNPGKNHNTIAWDD